MLKGKKSYILSLFVCAISILILGSAIPAQADDGTVGSETSPIIFNDTTPIDFYHTDADPWKGYFMLWTQNNTGTAWSGFNFSVAGSDAVFIDTASWDSAHTSPNLCADWSPDGSCDPTSSLGINSWNISIDEKSMSVSLSSNWGAGNTGWVKVYTDNTATQGNFTVTAAPVLVPEPVSSTLFIIGAATMGYRRFRKKA